MYCVRCAPACLYACVSVSVCCACAVCVVRVACVVCVKCVLRTVCSLFALCVCYMLCGVLCKKNVEPQGVLLGNLLLPFVPDVV
jgi:hypothetical protein